MPRTIPADKFARANEMRSEGMSTIAIARELGVSAPTVSRWTREQQAECQVCGEALKQQQRTFCSVACSNKVNVPPVNRGPENCRYNGGLTFDQEHRRWKICCTDGTQMYFYRAVMEAHLRRPLRSDEIVHHINGDPTDDRIENLELTTLADHMRIHRAELEAARHAR